MKICKNPSDAEFYGESNGQIKNGTVDDDVNYIIQSSVLYVFLFVIIILLTSSIKADSYLKSLQFEH